MKKVYLASPFFNDEEIKTMESVLEILRSKDLEVFAPFEHQNKHLEFGSMEWRKLYHTQITFGKNRRTLESGLNSPLLCLNSLKSI